MECPRCENSEIKATDNYCKICGLRLKETKKELELDCTIYIKLNEDKAKRFMEIDGNTPSVLTAMGMLAKSLKEYGVPEKAIKNVVEMSLVYKENVIKKELKELGVE